MTDLLKEIIDVDKAARERVAAAQKERSEAYVAVSSQREALIAEEKQKALAQAEEISRENRAAARAALETVREKNKAILDKMNRQYAENKERWVAGIVDGVLSEV